MSIIGKKGVTTPIDAGTFYCPSCLSTQAYVLKETSRFLAFWHIPLFRAGQPDFFVECQECKGTYIPRVLDYDPAQRDQPFMDQYQEVFCRALALVMMVDGNPSQEKKILMLTLLQQFDGGHLQLDDVEVILAAEAMQPQSVFDALKQIRPKLNTHGRDIILKSALTVATLEGPLNEFELVIITKMAESLGISAELLVSLISKSAA